MAPYFVKGGQGTLALMMNYIIGYCAVAASSSVNVVAMRDAELKQGIAVKDEVTNESYGVSKVAAKQAITDTVISRIVYVVPMFFVPALCNLALTKARLMPKQLGVTKVILESLGVALGLYIAMPVNCALFPQFSTIEVSKLEPEIQEKAKAKSVTHLVYNKGL